MLAVEFTDTLMRMDPMLEVYVQSGDRHSMFYFRVPDEWAALGDAELQRRVFAVARKMYEDLAAHFRAAEPNDINYLAVLGTRARVLGAEEEAGRPWVAAKTPAVWEWTPCVVVEREGTYRKVRREEF